MEGRVRHCVRPPGRTRGKPSHHILYNYKYLEYLYKYSIRLALAVRGNC